MAEDDTAGDLAGFVTERFGDILPFTYDSEVSANIPKVPTVDRLSDAQAIEVWTEIYAAYAITTDRLKHAFFNAFLAYLAFNRTSSEGEYSGTLPVEGHNFIVRIAVDVILSKGYTLRRFARTYADYVNLMFTNNRAQLAALAAHLGVDVGDALLATDFASGSSHTTPSQRQYTEMRRDRAVGKNRRDVRTSSSVRESSEAGSTSGRYVV